MEDKELEELLKLNIPNIEGNKDKVLEACKASKNKYNKKLTRRIYYIPSFVVLFIITILSIVLLSNRESIDISKINKAIDNLEYIDNDEEKMIAIMNIEKDIQNVSVDKKEEINLSKLSYEETATVSNLKKSVEWNDCLNDNDNYTSLDKIFNINEITDIRLIEGRYSSVMWEFNKAFCRDLLLKFDLPYINIIDKVDSFHNEYKDILSGDYNNEYTFFLKGADDSRTIQIRVYDSGYVLISITERNGTDIYDIELKSLLISLIPLEKADYLENYIKKEYDIKQSYVDAYLSGNYPAERVLIEKYYGNYNGYDVVLIKLADYGDTGMTKDVVIGNVTFHYLFSNREILLWTGNTFYKLSEAYEKGFVTEEDLLAIWLLENFDINDEKIIWQGSIDDEFTLDKIIVVLKRTTTCPELDISVFGLENATNMEYLSDVTPPSSYYEPEFQELLNNFRQIIAIHIEPTDKAAVIETVRIVEQLNFVKYVGPNLIHTGN